MDITIPLQFVKATKGTLVYGNEDKGLQGLYFPKVFFPKPSEPPPSITITLTIPEE